MEITLFRLVCEYRIVGLVCGIHKIIVQKVFYEVIKAINNRILWNVIKMPNDAECEGRSSQFERKSGYNNYSPPEGQKDFINNTHWASIVLQAVVDVNGRYNIFFSHKSNPPIQSSH